MKFAHESLTRLWRAKKTNRRAFLDGEPSDEVWEMDSQRTENHGLEELRWMKIILTTFNQNQVAEGGKLRWW